jgi:hypothetical protein
VIVEIITFRLAAGASSDEFLAADSKVQSDFYYRQPGIVRRTTARSGDDWCVVLFWQRMDDAQSAAQASASDPAAARFGALMDHGTVKVERYETLD